LDARLPTNTAAISRALRLARAFAADAALDAAVTDRLALVVEEWIANVVEHGGAHEGERRITLRLVLITEEPGGGAVVRVSVSDAGLPFDPRAAIFAGPNAERGGGAGLAMIASLCRIASYARRAGRNHLVLDMPLT
jgi:anti-sigma regulatory factor (Ser/Thr protein kinase)